MSVSFKNGESAENLQPLKCMRIIHVFQNYYIYLNRYFIHIIIIKKMQIIIIRHWAHLCVFVRSEQR